MAAKVWAIIAGAVGVLFVTTKKAAAAPASNVPLPPAAPSAQILKFAIAISVAEGYPVQGSIPQRANNPGDLALGGQTIGEGITQFATPDDGWRALYNQLVRIRDGRSTVYNVGMTIQEMAQRYAPFDADSWARNVAAGLGVSTDTMLAAVLL